MSSRILKSPVGLPKTVTASSICARLVMVIVAETLECLAEALHPGAFRYGHEGTGWERWEKVVAAAPESRENLG